MGSAETIEGPPAASPAAGGAKGDGHAAFALPFDSKGVPRRKALPARRAKLAVPGPPRSKPPSTGSMPLPTASSCTAAARAISLRRWMKWQAETGGRNVPGPVLPPPLEQKASKGKKGKPAGRHDAKAKKGDGARRKKKKAKKRAGFDPRRVKLRASWDAPPKKRVLIEPVERKGWHASDPQRFASGYNTLAGRTRKEKELLPPDRASEDMKALRSSRLYATVEADEAALAKSLSKLSLMSAPPALAAGAGAGDGEAERTARAGATDLLGRPTGEAGVAAESMVDDTAFFADERLYEQVDEVPAATPRGPFKYIFLDPLTGEAEQNEERAKLGRSTALAARSWSSTKLNSMLTYSSSREALRAIVQETSALDERVDCMVQTLLASDAAEEDEPREAKAEEAEVEEADEPAGASLTFLTSVPALESYYSSPASPAKSLPMEEHAEAAGGGQRTARKPALARWPESRAELRARLLATLMPARAMQPRAAPPPFVPGAAASGASTDASTAADGEQQLQSLKALIVRSDRSRGNMMTCLLEGEASLDELTKLVQQVLQLPVRGWHLDFADGSNWVCMLTCEDLRNAMQLARLNGEGGLILQVDMGGHRADASLFRAALKRSPAAAKRKRPQLRPSHTVPHLVTAAERPRRRRPRAPVSTTFTTSVRVKPLPGARDLYGKTHELHLVHSEVLRSKLDGVAQRLLKNLTAAGGGAGGRHGRRRTSSAGSAASVAGSAGSGGGGASKPMTSRQRLAALRHRRQSVISSFSTAAE
eukprot:PLAT2523.1.p1 GENE.PLAT2523.1~~PLAT2523.1.p1  ORF type:complete len:812 (+),score=282.16 PLAT2523.1:136-2436(+)